MKKELARKDKELSEMESISKEMLNKVKEENLLLRKQINENDSKIKNAIPEIEVQKKLKLNAQKETHLNGGEHSKQKLMLPSKIKK